MKTTKADRAAIERIYDCINRMSGIGPNNPADLRRKAECFDKMHEASSILVLSLSRLMGGDSQEAKSTADEAYQVIEKS